MIAALLPLTLSASAADTAKLHTDKVMAVPVTEKKILPVDLDQAAASQDVVLPQQPVHMTADTFFARNADGYVKSRGNVDIKQGMDEVHANYVEGNMKSGVYHTKGPVVYVNETNALTGQDVTYNSQNGSMSMDKVEGFMGPTTYIRGTDAEMYDNIGYVKHGLITTPHAVAKTPDYYITGDDIRIYPGEKFTAENTALWFKHVRLFTYGHYEGRLDNKNKTKHYIFTLLPRPTYNSDDGIGVRGYADVPLNQSGDLKFHASYALNSKNGLKPAAQIQKDTKIGSFRFGYSKEESTDNDDNIWATKWPELEYFAPRIHLGDTGIYIDSSANWGRWAEDGVKTGTHKGSARKSLIRLSPYGSVPMCASSPATARIGILPMMLSAAILIPASSSTRASTTACGPASGIRNTTSAATRRIASIPSMTPVSTACPSATS